MPSRRSLSVLLLALVLGSESLAAPAVPVAAAATGRDSGLGSTTRTPVATDVVSSSLRGTMFWPASGRITQRYGCTGFWANPRRGSCRHFHNGIDIANRRGTAIRAMASGVVRFIGRDPWDRGRDRAWMVIIRHRSGHYSWYAHMLPRYPDGVRRGRRVRQGQVIGYMGESGRATGIHLHFMVERNGSFVNPLPYLRARRPHALSAPTGAVAVAPSIHQVVARQFTGAWLA